MKESFSERQGFRAPEPPITVQNDAPDELREALPVIAEQAGLRPSGQRDVICRVLLKRPDPSNWSDYPNISNEVHHLLEACPWWKVYDIAEGLYAALPAPRRYPVEYDLAPAAPERSPQEIFVRKLNEVLVDNGIGWLMNDQGMIVLRSDSFSTQAVDQATTALADRSMHNSLRELKMALEGLSRRPEPDVTGVVQHSMAALEGLVREIVGSNRTLGQATKELEALGVPSALQNAISALYGYASSPRGGGRHGGEQLQVDRAEAQMLFHLSAALIAYLSARAEDPRK